jgi:hypothetical protein
MVDLLLTRGDVARIFGLSTRSLDRLISAGDFPQADARVGAARRLPNGQTTRAGRWWESTLRDYLKKRSG